MRFEHSMLNFFKFRKNNLKWSRYWLVLGFFEVLWDLLALASLFYCLQKFGTLIISHFWFWTFKTLRKFIIFRLNLVIKEFEILHGLILNTIGVVQILWKWIAFIFILIPLNWQNYFALNFLRFIRSKTLLSFCIVKN